MRNSWIFPVLFFMFIFGFGGIFSGLFFPLIIFFIIYKSVTKNNEERQTIRRRSSSGQSRTRLSGRQSDLVNEALSRYFRTHEKLPLLEEISLRPEKAEYTGLRNLVLLKDDGCIGTLDEFGERYPRLYNEILRLLVEFAKQPQTEEKPQTTADQKPEVPAEEADLPQAEPAQPELDRAEAYIEKINALNTEIANESITNGLYQTCALLKHLAIAEEKFPENKDKLDKLYQYYLPILLDILENYKNIGQSASNHEDFHEAEDRLNKTIILINEAMKTISATMAEDDLMSLSADMTTLEALLKKDGLVQEGTLSGVRK